MGYETAWQIVFGHPVVLTFLCGGGLIGLIVLGSLFLKSVRENADYRRVTGKDDD